MLKFTVEISPDMNCCHFVSPYSFRMGKVEMWPFFQQAARIYRTHDNSPPPFASGRRRRVHPYLAEQSNKGPARGSGEGKRDDDDTKLENSPILSNVENK